MVQMPPGVPVATVEIDGGRNAGLVAIQILMTQDAALLTRLVSYKAQRAAATREKDQRLQERVGKKNPLPDNFSSHGDG